MLRRILPIVLLALASFAIDARAQLISPDSAYSDKVNSASQMSDLMFLSGAPDRRYATFDESDEAYVYFRPGPEVSRTYPIKPKSTLVLYGRKDPSVSPDSSKIFVTFFNEELGITSKPIAVGDSVNVITVPDSQFTYVTLNMVYQPVMGDIIAYKRFYVDAVLLIQQFDPLSVRRSNDGRITSAQPNPFTVNRGTTISFTTEKYSDVSLVVMDVAGREVSKIDLGPRPAGTQSAEITVPNEGLYLGQLFIDGVPAGKAIKLTAQY